MTEDAIQEFVDELWNIIDRTPDGTKDYKWVCGKDGDRLYYSKQLAKQKGINLVDVIADTTIHCDCELVFNLEEED